MPDDIIIAEHCPYCNESTKCSLLSKCEDYPPGQFYAESIGEWISDFIRTSSTLKCQKCDSVFFTQKLSQISGELEGFEYFPPKKVINISPTFIQHYNEITGHFVMPGDKTLSELEKDKENKIFADIFQDYCNIIISLNNGNYTDFYYRSNFKLQSFSYSYSFINLLTRTLLEKIVIDCFDLRTKYLNSGKLEDKDKQKAIKIPYALLIPAEFIAENISNAKQIGSSLKKDFWTARDSGDITAHRNHSPSMEEVLFNINVVERFIEELFINPKVTEKMKSQVKKDPIIKPKSKNKNKVKKEEKKKKEVDKDQEDKSSNAIGIDKPTIH
jgi:hypothetical protein